MSDPGGALEAATGMNDPMLQIAGLCKSFPGVRALHNVRLEVERGTVHGLMGENGAGKSTLMRIICGLERADAGEVKLERRKLKLRGPHHALRLGIAMIHQELMPFPELTVAENIFMGQEPVRRFPGWIDRRRMEREGDALLRGLGVSVSPARRMKSLSVAEMQTVEIARALANDARLVIMDEPTSALSQREAESLFATITGLRQQGVAVIYISHKLEEVFQLTDRITVLRDGEHVASHETRELNPSRLIALMVGREARGLRGKPSTLPALEVSSPPLPRRVDARRTPLAEPCSSGRAGSPLPADEGLSHSPAWRTAECAPHPRSIVGRQAREERTASQEPIGDARAAHAAGSPDPAPSKREVILSVQGLRKEHAFRNVSFELRRGEVVGLAGLMGAGRTELVNALFGFDAADAGRILVHGREVRITHPRQAIAHGIGMVSEDRKQIGLVLHMSVKHNLTLSNLRVCCQGGFVLPRRENRLTDDLIRRFSIKTPDRSQRVNHLSGGNQQKVVLAKSLSTDPDILLLDEPTRGIDVGAKAEFHERIRGLARSGKAILMVSSELPEILALSDRILVMREGVLTAEFDGRSAQAEQIMAKAVPA